MGFWAPCRPENCRLGSSGNPATDTVRVDVSKLQGQTWRDLDQSFCGDPCVVEGRLNSDISDGGASCEVLADELRLALTALTQCPKVARGRKGTAGCPGRGGTCCSGFGTGPLPTACPAGDGDGEPALGNGAQQEEVDTEQAQTAEVAPGEEEAGTGHEQWPEAALGEEDAQVGPPTPDFGWDPRDEEQLPPCPGWQEPEEKLRSEAVQALLSPPSSNEDRRERVEMQKLEAIRAFLKQHGFPADEGVLGVNAKRRRFMRSMLPLHVAVANQDAKMVELLLWAGADASQKNSAGKTPLELAQRKLHGNQRDDARLAVVRELRIAQRQAAAAAADASSHKKYGGG